MHFRALVCFALTIVSGAPGIAWSASNLLAETNQLPDSAALYRNLLELQDYESAGETPQLARREVLRLRLATELAQMRTESSAASNKIAEKNPDRSILRVQLSQREISPDEQQPQQNGGSIIDLYDPLEGFNRGVYIFNAYVDNLVFLPALEVYDLVAPQVVQDRVSNFFRNLSNIITFANEILQLKPIEAGQTALRFAVNATVGLFGLFDPASAIDVPQNREDFGQTLGYWGVGAGPYIVLPILGPSNARDTLGFATDTVVFAAADPFKSSSFQTDRPPIFALKVIDQRQQVPFRYYDTQSPFEYELVRFLYTKKRELDIGR